MRTPIAVALVFLLGTVSISRADSTVDDAGRYVATFPGPVTHDSVDQDTAAGKITTHRINYKTDAVYYRAEYSDWPAADIAQHGASELYQMAIQGGVSAMDGKLRSQSPCKIGDIEGVECVMDVPKVQLVFRFRYFLVANRLYGLEYVGPPYTETSKSVEDFLNSFRLLR